MLSGSANSVACGPSSGCKGSGNRRTRPSSERFFLAGVRGILRQRPAIMSGSPRRTRLLSMRVRERRGDQDHTPYLEAAFLDRVRVTQLNPEANHFGVLL